jgi:hypothetical protein
VPVRTGSSDRRRHPATVCRGPVGQRVVRHVRGSDDGLDGLPARQRSCCAHRWFDRRVQVPATPFGASAGDRHNTSRRGADALSPVHPGPGRRRRTPGATGLRRTEMRVLRTAGCAAAALGLAAALEASPAMADDCGVVVVVQVGTCQSRAAQPSPGPMHHASPNPAPSPAVTLPGAPPVVPVAPVGSRTAVAVPAGSPQTSTRPAVGTVPVEVTTAAAIADTSPSPVPTRTTTPGAVEASPPRGHRERTCYGRCLAVGSGRSACCRLSGARPQATMAGLCADLTRDPGKASGSPWTSRTWTPESAPAAILATGCSTYRRSLNSCGPEKAVPWTL